MACFETQFGLHDKVVIDGEIGGVVTMVRLHPKYAVDYFVAWWSQGNMVEQWIDEDRLSAEAK